MNAARFLAIGFFLWISAAARAGAAPYPDAPYDANPAHLWNRLHETLFVRTAPDGERYGGTELDILYWAGTQNLLTPPSHDQAIRVLDEFIDDQGERLIRDPLKRALLQRDLWQLFDWSASYFAPPSNPAVSRARLELERRLVTVIQRLALPTEDIRRLPDNYADAAARIGSPGFPRGLFAADSAWVIVGRADGTVAREHAAAFGGRSVFLVFVKLPGGRESGLRYLQTLREFVPALVYAHDGLAQRLRTNPATPQFPAGTEWALVRRLCLIDDRGDIQATRLIESIQTRRYVTIPDAGGFNGLRNAQAVAEFQLDRARPPALRVVEEGERDFQFVHFRSHGMDPMEHSSAPDWAQKIDQIRGETLRTCMVCHQPRGILSINTYAGFGLQANSLDASTPEQEKNATLEWKSRRFDWGLLKGLWQR